MNLIVIGCVSIIKMSVDCIFEHLDEHSKASRAKLNFGWIVKTKWTIRLKKHLTRYQVSTTKIFSLNFGTFVKYVSIDSWNNDDRLIYFALLSHSVDLFRSLKRTNKWHSRTWFVPECFQSEEHAFLILCFIDQLGHFCYFEIQVWFKYFFFPPFTISPMELICQNQDDSEIFENDFAFAVLIIFCLCV